MKSFILVLATLLVSVTCASALTIDGIDNWDFYEINYDLSGEIDLTGTYYGSPTAIEARFNGGAWFIIDANPSGGTYAGTLKVRPGHGSINVRGIGDDTDIKKVSDIGVGFIFFAVGQSNALGMSQTLFTSDAQPATCKYAHVWQEYIDPAPIGHTLGSAYPYLATMMQDINGIPIAVINTAVGSSHILEHQSYSDPGDAGPWTASIVAACDVDDKGKMAGFLFYQGEADTDTSANANAWLALARTSFEYYRSMVANFPKVFVARIHSVWTGSIPEYVDIVQQSQETVWGDPEIFQGPDMKGLVPTSESGDIHWSTPSEMWYLAGQWHTAIERAYPLRVGSASTRGSAAATLTGTRNAVLF